MKLQLSIYTVDHKYTGYTNVDLFKYKANKINNARVLQRMLKYNRCCLFIAILKFCIICSDILRASYTIYYAKSLNSQLNLR